MLSAPMPDCTNVNHLVMPVVPWPLSCALSGYVSHRPPAGWSWIEALDPSHSLLGAALITAP